MVYVRLATLGPGKGRLYLLAKESPGADRLEMLAVDLGITDGSYTVLETALANAKVVIDENDDPGKAKSTF